jgi:hypothetical protein
MSQKAKTLARRLLRQNRGTRKFPARSWRVIARDDYANKIPAGTLNRFALSEGEWYPKDEGLQIVLGLKKQQPAAKRDMRPIFDRPADVLLWQLINREVLQ